MKLKANVGKKERIIEIRREGTSLSVSIDGADREYEVSEPEPGSFLLKSKDGIYESFVSRAGSDGPYHVLVGTEEFEVEIQDPKRLRGSGSRAGAEDGPAKIKSAMPGKIVRVLASVGDVVKSGAGIVVVEAMKMQNELKSPKDGKVIEILVSEEDRVNSGDILAVIE